MSISRTIGRTKFTIVIFAALHHGVSIIYSSSLYGHYSIGYDNSAWKSDRRDDG